MCYRKDETSTFIRRAQKIKISNCYDYKINKYVEGILDKLDGKNMTINLVLLLRASKLKLNYTGFFDTSTAGVVPMNSEL